MRRGMKIYAISFFLYLGCYNSCKNISNVYTTQKCATKYSTINLADIIKSVSSYDGHFVEISGYYDRSTEAAVIAIYPRGNENNVDNMLWVDFDSELAKVNGKDTIYLFKSESKTFKFAGKRVKIRGTIEGRRYAGYAARIKDVCYLEILD
jgi:hypothetical protein